MSLEQLAKRTVADVLFVVIAAFAGLVVVPLIVAFRVLNAVLTWSFFFIKDFAPMILGVGVLWLTWFAGAGEGALYTVLTLFVLVAVPMQVFFVMAVWDQRDYRGAGGIGFREVRGPMPHSLLYFENGVEDLLEWVAENSYLYAREELRERRKRDAFLDEGREARQWAAEQNEKNKCKA